jgi:glycerol-3-phosphate acyltransferase PlsY
VGTALVIAAALVAGYLLGGIPSALIVGKLLHGTDVREHGSGNLGATNVYRVLGPTAGLATFAIDMAKGSAAVGIAMLLAPAAWGTDARDWLLLGAGIASILGHAYTPFAGFRGGKGVATATGVVAVLTPLTLPILVATFVVTVAATRLVSLGSIVVAVEYPLLTLALYPDRPVLAAFAAGGALLLLWRHRSNMRRLLRREEPRVEWSRGAVRSADGGEGDEG